MGEEFDLLQRRVNVEMCVQGGVGEYDSLPLFCECGREKCFTPVWLTRPEFAQIVEGGGRVLAEGHAPARPGRAPTPSRSRVAA